MASWLIPASTPIVKTVCNHCMFPAGHRLLSISWVWQQAGEPHILATGRKPAHFSNYLWYEPTTHLTPHLHCHLDLLFGLVVIVVGALAWPCRSCYCHCHAYLCNSIAAHSMYNMYYKLSLIYGCIVVVRIIYIINSIIIIIIIISRIIWASVIVLRIVLVSSESLRP
jgi:hypothetical protein